MKITQLHALVNQTTQEVLGETALVQDDLSNVVDIGKQIIKAGLVPIIEPEVDIHSKEKQG